MKKLMKTVVASAVALVASGAFATLPSPTANFSEIATGEKTVSDLVSNGDDKYWFAITNNNQELSGVVGVVTNDTDQGNFLTLDAQAPVYRTINEVNGSGYGAVVDGLTAETIGTDGIYLDTMVKFTVSSDNTFGDLDTVNDKLAITCYSTDEGDGGPTNILVRAGYVGSSVTPINYVLNIPEDFDINKWHRLTVRAIADVGYASAPVGFAIYLDEELLKYDTSVAAGEQTYTDSLNAAVVENLYNSETHALLPSLVTSGENLKKLTAVGFKGSGSVDDILFTNDKPSFIVEGQSVTIEWDEGVATYTVVDSNNKTLVDAASTSDAVSTNLTLDAGVTYLTVTATYKTSYEAGTWTKTAGTLSNGVWTFANNGASLKIVSMQPKFEVNGVKYGSFNEALENAVGTQGNPATIKLLASWEGDIEFDTENVNYIIIDLAGQTLTGDSDAAIHTGVANIIITNSTVEIGHVVAPNFDADKGGTAIVCDGAGAALTVAAGIFDGAIVPDASGVVIEVTGGKFYDNEYAEDPTGEFYLEAHVDTEKYAISEADANFYFTVSEKAPIGTYNVTVTPTANTAYEAVYNDGGATVEFVNDVAAVTVGQTITITVTPASGYEYADTPTGWTAGQDGKITIEVSEAGTVVIPAPTAVSSSDLDPAINTPVEIEAESEAAATNAVQLVTPSGVAPAAYKDLFDFTVTPVVPGEKYEVEIAGIKESVELAVEESAMDVLDGKLGAKVQVPAGLNYKITTYETLGGSAVNTTSGQSDGTGVSVSKPGTTQGFIKIEMATVPFN